MEYKSKTKTELENSEQYTRAHFHSKSPFYIETSILDKYSSPKEAHKTIRYALAENGEHEHSECLWIKDKWGKDFFTAKDTKISKEYTKDPITKEIKNWVWRFQGGPGGAASINMPLARMLQTGSPSGVFYCKITGMDLEHQTITCKVNNIEYIVSGLVNFHHMVFQQGTSIYKENADPMSMIKNSHLKGQTSKIVDLSGTVVLCNDAHSRVHSIPEGDIRQYSNDQLPYLLQNEDQFNECIHFIKIEFDVVFPYNYQDFIDKLTLS